MLNQEQKNQLLKIARLAIEAVVQGEEVGGVDNIEDGLRGKEGAFVTIRKGKELRGCIGQIISQEDSLAQLVQKMAIEAATSDPRFLPVSSGELSGLQIEVSVLSEPQKINDWQKIEMGKHGVIVSKFGQGGVFLPQVAKETGWSKEEFLEQLCSQKAGFDKNAYKNDPEIRIEVFTAQVFGEK